MTELEDFNRIARQLAFSPRDTSRDPRWPWKDATDLTGPMSPGQVWVLGGYPGNGKTAILLNLAHGWLERRIPWVYAGLEMSDHVLTSLVAGVHAKLSRREIVEGQLEGPQQEALREAIQWMADKRYHFIPEAELTPGQFVFLAEEAAKELEAPIVILDHLHHLTYPGQNIRIEVTDAIRQIKASATRTPLCYLIACQLSRTGDRLARWRMPELHQLKESGDIEAVADVVLFSHRLVKEGFAKEAKAYLQGEGTPAAFEHTGRIALTQQKHRLGRRIGYTVPLTIHSPSDHITEIEEDVVLWGSDEDAERE